MVSFLKKLTEAANNEYAAIVEEGLDADVVSYVDTGSYALNALLSGSIYKGIAGNKVVALAGESSTGKTFVALGIAKAFQDANKDGQVIYFDSESAITSEMIKERGMDPTRMAILPADTVENFRTQMMKILKELEETKESERQPVLFVLDSLGELSTSKEMNDTLEGKETRDMTRAQVVKSLFRVITLKLGRLKCSMIVTNHVYDVIGSMFPQKKMGGGSGLVYAASQIISLSKRKDKDKENEVTGAILTASLQKSRLTKENRSVSTLVSYDHGLDRYYGLLDIAEKYGIFTKVSNKYEVAKDVKVFENAILKNPTKYFTKEVLDRIDEACAKEFCYGKNEVVPAEEVDETVTEE